MTKEYKKIKAILGPTNTGKTYLSIRTMLSYQSGMIGFPLRLLAREVYDQLANEIGFSFVALITGEEKIIPKNPKFYICTVEAMPLDIEVDFLAIDEVQLASDPERGHIYTDRLLYSRGNLETIFLGSLTIKKLILSIIPDIEIITRPRLSKLTYSGSKKISKLPKRTAIVAFSINRVYEIADFIRQQNGGAAVVLGALSPRTRNAQVEIYQSGGADYLVATDAIGMGLNSDIDHVMFDSIKKYDGKKYRPLFPIEIAQIAGRAGRYKNDGTFSISSNLDPLEPEIINNIENHRFEYNKSIKWRNSDLDFSSLNNLLASLSLAPPDKIYSLNKQCEDAFFLEYISSANIISHQSLSYEKIKLLWEICQMPDYRKNGIENHSAIIAKVYNDLTGSKEYIDDAWLEKEVKYASNIDGDIDSLSNKISYIRTCNYITNKKNWIKDPVYWQELTRKIEDKLSDALHNKLTNRFIDRHASVLISTSKNQNLSNIKLDSNNQIMINGELFGNINGLKFINITNKIGLNENKSAKSALNRIIKLELEKITENILSSEKDDFILDNNNHIIWNSCPVAEIKKGSNILSPNIRLIKDTFLSANNIEKIFKKISTWLDEYISDTLSDLIKLDRNNSLKGYLSGLKYTMKNNLGIIDRNKISIKIADLNKDEKIIFRSYGIYIGETYIYIKKLLKPEPTRLKYILHNLYFESIINYDLGSLYGKSSSKYNPKISEEIYDMIGYKICDPFVIRIDIFERLSNNIRDAMNSKELSSNKSFTITPKMLTLVGCTRADFEKILRSIGYMLNKKNKTNYGPTWIKKRIINLDKIDKKIDKKNLNAFSILSSMNNASN